MGLSVTNGTSGAPAQSAGGFHREWKAFAVRRWTALLLLFGWLPACEGLFLLSRHWMHMPLTAIAVMVVWLLGALAAVWWAGEFRCPRCSRRYAALGNGIYVKLTRGLFDSVCSNCKLAKFEGLGVGVGEGPGEN